MARSPRCRASPSACRPSASSSSTCSTPSARIFELHGFVLVETRAVEPLDQLLRKGEIDKEVYVLRRLHAAEDDADEPAGQLGLHFDLTVPFARYVLENAGHLEFPFRRYQIQKVWRGERPQEGRYREFTQADIDIVGRDELAFHHEVEVALVMAEVFAALPIPAAADPGQQPQAGRGLLPRRRRDDPTPRCARSTSSTRSVASGSLDCSWPRPASTPQQAEQCLRWPTISGTDDTVVDQVRALGVEHPLLDEGLAELVAVVDGCRGSAPGCARRRPQDRPRARLLHRHGLRDRAGRLRGRWARSAPAAATTRCASDGRVTYPGVGISLGVSRLLVPLLSRGLVDRDPLGADVRAGRRHRRDATRAASEPVADALRARGIPTEVAPAAAKFGKQIRYADRRGIPFVWFPGGDGPSTRSRTSAPATRCRPTRDAWSPPAADLHPTVTRVTRRPCQQDRRGAAP